VADWTVLRFISTPSPSHPCQGETTKSNRFLSRMIGVRKTRKAQQLTGLYFALLARPVLVILAGARRRNQIDFCLA
ncbi:hypothetical protein C1O33_12125, partial [Staphylococcus schleiferi]|nr:hypothetical protein [Staphylococcus schleiferi]